MKTWPLNFDWRFKEGFNAVDLTSFEGETVHLPHTIKEVPLRYFDDQTTAVEAVYAKDITLEPKKNHRYFIRFEGVMARCDVYVNSIHKGHFKGGFTPFEIELDASTLIHQLVVHVDAKETADQPPFGGVIDYLTYGGIYRDVTLIERPKHFLKHVLVDGNQTHYRLRLIPETQFVTEMPLKVELCDDETSQHVWHETVSLHEPLDFTKAHALKLWCLGDPKRYTLKVWLDQELVFDDFVAFRTIKVDDRHFYLNDEVIFIRGLNRHQSFPYVGYAMPASAQREDADHLKEVLQVNMVRSAHYPPSRHFLNRCDEIGLMVFTELPGWQHLGDDAWKEEAKRQLEIMTYEDYNHPSIVILGTRINESPDDDAFYQATQALVKTIDTTRPTGGVRFITHSHLYEDIYTFNDFSHTGQNAGVQAKKHVTKVQNPYLITEHNGHMFPTKVNDHEQKRVEHALRHATVMHDAYANLGIMGVIGWVMNDYNTHKEFGSNDHICHHGVNDIMRNPKYAAYLYASQGDKPVAEVLSMMHIGDHAGGQLSEVWVATNADYVELYKNDEYVGVFYPNTTRFPQLPHPPILMDDFIGERIAMNEPLSQRDANLVKGLLRRLLKRNLKMTFKDKLIMGYVLVKNKLTYSDAVRFYTTYVGGWGEKESRYTIKAYKDKTCFKTIHKGFNDDYHLNVTPMRTTFSHHDSYDTVRVQVSLENAYGERAFYDDSVMTLSAEGPLAIIGPPVRAMTGGVQAVWVKSLAPGQGRLTITHPRGKHTQDFTIT